MCGRYTLYQSSDIIAERFAAELTAEIEPRYNIAPTDMAAVVVAEGGRRRIEAYRWGLVPSWAADMSVGSRMINARAETLAEKPVFRPALAGRRCIVPADGFYEWKAKPGRVKGVLRQPYYIHPTRESVLALAGLWSVWRRPDGGGMVKSFTIITVPANGRLAGLHDRMPAILRPEDAEVWLDSSIREASALTSLLATAPDEWIDLYPVTTAVNVAGRDDPAFILPVELPASQGEPTLDLGCMS
ncbi:MAG: SOS response-associated peptidase [Capsulimonadaceae bacterium]